MATKRKIEMKKREKKEQRSVTFSKRCKGLFKKADDLHTLTGASVAVLAFTPGGKPHTCGYPSFDDTVARYFRSLGEVPDESIISLGETRHEERSRFGAMKAWVEGIHAEGCSDLEELSGIKQKLEEIKMEIIMQMDNDLANSFLNV